MTTSNDLLSEEPSKDFEPLKESLQYMNEYDDFAKFSNQLDLTHIKKYNFSELKTNAYELIDKLKGKHNNIESIKYNELIIFKPEDSVSIVINELKQLDKMENIELVIENNNIYDIKLICWSEKINTNIEFNIQINMLEYPYGPPRINITKPMMTQNFNYYINTMDCFILDNWNPTNSIPYIITELLKLIDKYGILNEDQTNIFSELSNILTELSIITKINPILNESNSEKIIFQIPYVKYNQSNQSSPSNQSNQSNPSKQLWKSGTGYGSSGSTKWDIKKYLESDQYKINKLDLILLDIINMITNKLNDPSVTEIELKNQLRDIKNSCLVNYIVTNLTDNLNISYVQSNKSYIINLIKLCNIIFDIDNSLFNIYKKTFKNNIDIFNIIKKLSLDNNSAIIESLISLYTKINSYCESIIEENLSESTKSIESTESTESIESTELTEQQQYVNILKKYQWEMVSGLSNICSNGRELINKLYLCKEISILSKSLPIDYNSSIYVRVDENNMQSIHALIIPSDDTPYAFGCYLFHIFIPETYNKMPPLVKIINTGNGSVRFNPNLYADGKVCLSLLGTWQGDPSEMWNDTSSLLQVLISIQSLIFIDEPYFNEPGHERSINTEQGKKTSKEYNKNIKFNNLTWAMVDMLKKPPKGFENVINMHFKLKGNKILSEVKKWISEVSNISAFEAKYNELKDLINKLN